MWPINDKIILYGNGGHSKVLKDCAKLLRKEVQLIFDDEFNVYNPSLEPDKKIIIAIGNNKIREDIVEKISHKFETLKHPKSVIAKDVKIGEGSVILANSVIQAGAVIGKHVIINASVTIDHDVIIEDFVSIYPGSYIGGGAKICKGCLVEPNSVIKRNQIIK